MNVLQVASGGLFAVCCSRSVKLYSSGTMGGNPRAETVLTAQTDSGLQSTSITYN